jgi:diguanylate cyclase (GGDEF)-like protein
MIFDKLLLLTSKKSPLQHIILTISWVILLFMIGWLDFATPGLSLMIFYVLVVIIVSLVLGPVDGTMSAIIGAAINYAANWKDPGVINPDLKTVGFILSFFILVIIEMIVIQLKKLLDREKVLSRLDFLTGSANVRFFREILDREIKRSARTGRPFSLAYIDFDDFKTLNDTLGHSAGDDILKSAIGLIKKNLRENDSIGRVGGDEFVILLVETGKEAVKSVIKRIIKNFHDEMALRNYNLTLSLGYTAFIKTPKSVDEALKAADKAMYMAKNSGKNRVYTAVFK